MAYRDPEKARAARERKNAKRRRGIGRGRHGNHLRGSAHPRWNHGQLLSTDGYVKVRAPGHHRAGANGYAYEHDLIMEAHLGRHLLPGELVHHRDDCKSNNVLSNLQLKTRIAHGRLHAERRQRDPEGRFV